MTHYDYCVRTLLEKYPTMSMVFDEFPGIYVVPTVLDEGSTEIEENVGRMEYQVSDGMPGDRSTSYDCYDLAEALEMAKDLSRKLNQEKP